MLVAAPILMSRSSGITVPYSVVNNWMMFFVDDVTVLS